MPVPRFTPGLQVLDLGLAKVKRKYKLCYVYGRVEWKSGNIKEAIYWWAQGVHSYEAYAPNNDPFYGKRVTLGSFNHPTGFEYYGSHLYLAIIAYARGLTDVGAALQSRANMMAGYVKVGIKPESEELELKNSANADSCRGIDIVLIELCSDARKSHMPGQTLRLTRKGRGDYRVQSNIQLNLTVTLQG